jgi:DNA-directed RNA polymerase alpha subunit
VGTRDVIDDLLLGGRIVEALRAAGANDECLVKIAQPEKQPVVIGALRLFVEAVHDGRTLSNLRLSVRVMNVLNRHFDFDSDTPVARLTALTANQLLASKSFSKDSFQALKDVLQSHGLKFREEDA